MKIILLFFSFIIFSLEVSADVTSVELFRTINKRLSHMEEVALFKAQNHLPIEDIEQEKIVIQRAIVSARDKGLDPDSIEDFFKAQISVAKAVQLRYRADLRSRPSSIEPKDLQKEVRPCLLRLGDQIIQQMIMYIKTHGSFKPTQFADFDSDVNVKYVTASDKQLLFNALLKVRHLPVE